MFHCVVPVPTQSSLRLFYLSKSDGGCTDFGASLSGRSCYRHKGQPFPVRLWGLTKTSTRFHGNIRGGLLVACEVVACYKFSRRCLLRSATGFVQIFLRMIRGRNQEVPCRSCPGDTPSDSSNLPPPSHPTTPK